MTLQGGIGRVNTLTARNIYFQYRMPVNNNTDAPLTWDEVKGALKQYFQEIPFIRHIDPHKKPIVIPDDYIHLSMVIKPSLQQSQDNSSSEKIYGERKAVKWQELFHPVKAPRIKIENIREYPATKYLISAPPGGGKTTFLFALTQYYLNHAPKESSLRGCIILRCRDLNGLKEDVERGRAIKLLISDILRDFFSRFLCDKTGQNIEISCLSEIISEVVGKPSQFLLALDGLDELDAKVKGVVHALCESFPYHIISGRPHALTTRMKNPDYITLELQPLTKKNKIHYIEKYFEEESNINKLALINIVKTLVKQLNTYPSGLPICLDALCFLAQEIFEERQKENINLSLIYIYQGVITKLLYHYYVRRRQQDETEEALKCMDYPKQPEWKYLSQLAYESLLEEMTIQIHPVHWLSLFNRFLPQTKHPNRIHLLECGLLVSCADAGRLEQQSFEFVHLSFMEFMSAWHLAEKLTKAKNFQKFTNILEPLRRATLESRYQYFWEKVLSLLCESNILLGLSDQHHQWFWDWVFLEKEERFNQHYNIFIRNLFTTSTRPFQQKDSLLNLIFDSLSSLKNSNKETHQLLKNQITIDLKIGIHSVILAYLLDKNEGTQEIVLSVLRHQTLDNLKKFGIFKTLQLYLVDTDPFVRCVALKVCKGKTLEILKKHGLLDAIYTCLADLQNIDVCCAALDIILHDESQEALKNTRILDILFICLKDKNINISRIAWEILYHQPLIVLKETGALQVILNCLAEENNDIRCIILEILEKHFLCNLNELGIKEIVLNCLTSKDKNLREAAFELLKASPTEALKESDILNVVLRNLTEQDDNASWEAWSILKSQPLISLKEIGVLNIILAYLESKDEYVQENAWELLKNNQLSALHEVGIAEVVLSYLANKKWRIRHAAWDALQNWSLIDLKNVGALEHVLAYMINDERTYFYSYYEEPCYYDWQFVKKQPLSVIQEVGALKTLFAALKNPAWYVRTKALYVLEKSAVEILIELGLLKSLLTCLVDEPPPVRRATLRVFQGNSIIALKKAGALEPLLACLEDKDFETCMLAWKFLNEKSLVFLEEIGVLQNIISCLTNKYSHVRSAALRIFLNQPLIILKAAGGLEIILSYLAKEKDYMHSTNLGTLQGLSIMELKELGVLEAILGCLTSRNDDVRITAAKILQNQPLTALQEVGMLEVVLAHLKNNYSYVRVTTWQIFQGQSLVNLEKLNIIDIILTGLSDRDSYARRAAFVALRSYKQKKKSSVYLTIIQHLIGLLKNPLLRMEAANALIYYSAITLETYILLKQYDIPYAEFKDATQQFSFNVKRTLIHNMLAVYQMLSPNQAKLQAKQLIDFLYALDIRLICIDDELYIESDPLISLNKENRKLILKKTYLSYLQQEISHLMRNSFFSELEQTKKINFIKLLQVSKDNNVSDKISTSFWKIPSLDIAQSNENFISCKKCLD